MDTQKNLNYQMTSFDNFHNSPIILIVNKKKAVDRELVNVFTRTIT